MLSFFSKSAKKKALVIALAALTAVTMAGCGKSEKQAQSATLVRTMEVIRRDTPIVYDYTGFMQAVESVSLQAKVGGQVVGKYFKGGEKVTPGQLLYTIDPRTYRADVLNAQAGLANARAELIKANQDLERYTKLYEQSAVSKQSLDNYIASAAQAQASVNAQEALLEVATINFGDTNVVAPFEGRIDTNDISVGTYVTAGNTTMATITTMDPMYLEFSMPETEYLKLLSSHTSTGGTPLDNLTVSLSDGQAYPHKGHINQVNQSITQGTGTLTLKAEFANPDRILLPGMFGHLQADSGIIPNAMLIPQRAVTELLYRKFVYVVDSENKVSMKEITTGQRIGRLWLVEGGLDGNETIVVEGINKIRPGSTVNPEPMTEADLNTSITTNEADSKSK